MEDYLPELNIPDMLSDFTDKEFEEWLKLGLFLPADILSICLESTRRDLEINEEYEKCIILNKFINDYKIYGRTE